MMTEKLKHIYIQETSHMYKYSLYRIYILKTSKIRIQLDNSIYINVVVTWIEVNIRSIRFL